MGIKRSFVAAPGAIRHVCPFETGGIGGNEEIGPRGGFSEIRSGAFDLVHPVCPILNSFHLGAAPVAGKVRAGTPIAVAPAGTSEMTREFGATIAQSPMVT